MAAFGQKGAVTTKDQRLRESMSREQRMLRALHSGAVGWYEWDVKADIVVGNLELARDFGLDDLLTREGAPIETFFANIHPLDREAIEHAVKEAIATGEPFREEYRVVHPQGRIVWISARGACLRDEAGEPASFAGVIIDITERKEAEQRLREVDLRRELAMSAARLGSWDHDPLTNVRRYDARGLELFGLTAEEAPHLENSYAVLHPDDRERMGVAAAAAMDPERSGPFRETFRVVDRESGAVRWLSAIGRTEFVNGICTRFVGVLDDVTEDKQAEEHRALLVNELNHRVKNNLAVVASIVNASLRSAADLAGAREDINSRLQSLGRAHDLLTAESWVSADVATVVAQAVETLSLPGARIEIGGPVVRLSPKPALQLSLALHELGTNALKYGALSNDRGRIAIRWDIAGGEGAVARHFGFRWIESGGPVVTAPPRRGFGTRLIEAATAAEFQGSSRLAYSPAGLAWELDAPLAGIEAGSDTRQ